MELGGWRTRSMLCRYNVVSESDLANALDRVSHYVAERAQEAARIRPIHGEPAQNPHNRAMVATNGVAAAVLTPRKKRWRRAGSNSRPRDYETLALAN